MHGLGMEPNGEYRRIMERRIYAGLTAEIDLALTYPRERAIVDASDVITLDDGTSEGSGESGGNG